MKRALVGLLALALTGCDGCSDSEGAVDAAPVASASSAAPGVATRASVSRIEAAEQRRDSAAIRDEDLSSRSVAVRRTAARALARIADARAAELLKGALRDEDPEVVSWAAYGLGYTCQGSEPATVRALVARAASLTAADARVVSLTDAKAASLSPLGSIADALARCGSGEAERTLRAWLSGPNATSAALALGKLASRHKRLEDTSVVALLDAASRPEQPLGAALFAFTRLGSLDGSVQERLREVAVESLKGTGQRRAFAVRALGKAGPEAAEPLGKVVVDTSFSAGERANAARALAMLDEAGQAQLAIALSKLAPDKPDAKQLGGAAYGPLITTLDALVPPAREARPTLEQLSELPIADGASASLKRRIVRLRCGAAALLAGTASLSTRLVACDPEKGRIGALAVVRVLDRGKLEGGRYRRWLELAKSDDPVVREAAIGLMAGHPEIPKPEEVLSAALGSKQPGVVASAAQILAAYPDRGSAAEGRPRPSVVKALDAAFAAKRPPDAIETLAALIDAAGALQLLSHKARVQKACRSANPTLRKHAEKALVLMGERGRKCDSFEPPKKPPAELAGAPPKRVTLELSTDAGTLSLTLDPALAPVSVKRIGELAKSGFYDGIVVHRVVPGFVAQFGDPNGDGFGGAGKPPLRCETSPLPFEAGAVGVALAGRDTGSSQLFVTLGPYPHLDGDYPLIGQAGPGWEKLAEGDVIRKVTVTAAD